MISTRQNVGRRSTPVFVLRATRAILTRTLDPGGLALSATASLRASRRALPGQPPKKNPGTCAHRVLHLKSGCLLSHGAAGSRFILGFLRLVRLMAGR